MRVQRLSAQIMIISKHSQSTLTIKILFALYSCKCKIFIRKACYSKKCFEWLPLKLLNSWQVFNILRSCHKLVLTLKESKYKSKHTKLVLRWKDETINANLVNFRKYHCQVKNKSFWSINLSLLTCWKDHLQKPCKPVFLHYYYYTTVTKWNCLKSKLERKQMKHIYTQSCKITIFFNGKTQIHHNQTIWKPQAKILWSLKNVCCYLKDKNVYQIKVWNYYIQLYLLHLMNDEFMHKFRKILIFSKLVM